MLLCYTFNGKYSERVCLACYVKSLLAEGLTVFARVLIKHVFFVFVLFPSLPRRLSTRRHASNFHPPEESSFLFEITIISGTRGSGGIWTIYVSFTCPARIWSDQHRPSVLRSIAGRGYTKIALFVFAWFKKTTYSR